ncbi:hypothetical protein RTJ51_19660, partial [Bacillus siamensis]|nr:hypothetical protein [Bacillus siamensis]
TVIMMVVIMVMVMTVVMMVMVMVVIVAGLEEIGLDLQDAVEVERAALQHVGQANLTTFGTVQLCVGIDAADAGLDLGKLGLGDQVGLVQH